MVEAAILSVITLALVLGELAIWRALRRAPRRWTGRAGRIVPLTLVTALLVFFSSWRLSKSRSFQFFGHMVARVETSEPVVALTFDDGPAPGRTEEIIDILQTYGIRATFFLTGQAIEDNMAQCRMLAAGGHELGNHTYSHQHMTFRSFAFIQQEIETTDRLLRACGYEGDIHVRSPYGKRLVVLPYYLSITDRLNIFFDVEPESYPEIAADADLIVEHVLEETRPGSIILLHVMPEPRLESMKAVPAIIEGLQARGYRFVTVSELLSMAGR